MQGAQAAGHPDRRESARTAASPMVIKFGRFGQFLACSNYPECRTTREVAKPQADARRRFGRRARRRRRAARSAASRGDLRAVRQADGDEARALRASSSAARATPSAATSAAIEQDRRGRARARAYRGETCPVDGAQLVRRHGRSASSSRAPTTRRASTSSARRPASPARKPGCKGEIVVKKSKRGKVFYGCSEYPKCDTVYWDKPVTEPCPQCNAPVHA